MSRCSIVVCSAAFALASSYACSSDDMPAEQNADIPALKANEMEVRTPAFEIAGGDETMICTVSDVVLERDFDVVEMHGFQGRGGHHAALFYSTDANVVPGAPHVCGDEEMASWRMIGAGAEGAELGFELPAGMALRVPAGARLVVQSHYLNTDPEPRMVEDTVRMATAVDPSAITQLVDPLAINDADFRLPPRGMQTRTSECVAEEPMELINALGHQHQYGAHVEINLRRGATGAMENLYDERWSPDLQFTPPRVTFPEAIRLEAGDSLRLSCTWMNTSTEVIEFPSEMCTALFFVTPATGFRVCGEVIETLGDTVGAEDPGSGQHGCDAPPAEGEGCVRDCDLGNSRGVGKYCTRGGNECARNGSAIFCTADVDGGGPGFCTRPCMDDSVCGPEAYCTGDERGMGCVPALCR